MRHPGYVRNVHLGHNLLLADCGNRYTYLSLKDRCTFRMLCPLTKILLFLHYNTCSANSKDCSQYLGNSPLFNILVIYNSWGK